MKKRLFKYTWLPIGLGAMIAATSIPTMISCGKNIKAEGITVYSVQNYVFPGDKLQMKAKVEPEGASAKLKWSLVDCSFTNVTINDEGVISVPNDVTVSGPTSVTVKATNVDNEEMFSTYKVAITPKTDNVFMGFIDSKITYLDEYGQETSANIVKEENSDTYRVDKHINLFVGKDDQYIDFIPVIKVRNSKKMKFHLFNEYGTPHALAWYQYSDGDLTESIPRFVVNWVEYRHDNIEVTFSCDDFVTRLIINVDVYQLPEQESPGCFGYKPDDDNTDERHYVDQNGQGVFLSSLPYDVGVEHSEEVMSKIYCYRKPYELLNFNFEVEIHIDSRLLDTLLVKNITVSEPVKEKREFDGYEFYSFNISYEFNPVSLAKVIAWRYESMSLFTIKAWDPLDTVSPACTLEFSLDWYIE